MGIGSGIRCCARLKCEGFWVSLALSCELGAILFLSRSILNFKYGDAARNVERHCLGASILAGVGLAANYSFLFAFVGLFLVYIIFVLLKSRNMAIALRCAWSLAWPAAAILLVICLNNVATYSSKDLFWGTLSVKEMLDSIAQPIFGGPSTYITPPHLRTALAFLVRWGALIFCIAFVVSMIAVTVESICNRFLATPVFIIMRLCTGAAALALGAHLALFAGIHDAASPWPHGIDVDPATLMLDRLTPPPTINSARNHGGAGDLYDMGGPLLRHELLCLMLDEIMYFACVRHPMFGFLIISTRQSYDA
jgi:hypothetical protein